MGCLFSQLDAHIHCEKRHWDAYLYVKMGIQDAQFLGCLYLLDTGIADTIMSVVSSLQRKVWQCLVAGKVELVSDS